MFLILVARAPAMRVGGAPVRGRRGASAAWPGSATYVNHYSFHIMDPACGHLVIKMAGHAPFGAQVILNGHEYVAVAAQAERDRFHQGGELLY